MNARALSLPRTLAAAKIGATVGPYVATDDDIYTRGESEPDRVRLTVRVTPDREKEVEAAVRTFNALDQVLGVKRKKWKEQNVLERFVLRGLDALWKQIGGPPRDDEDEAAFAKRIARKFRESEEIAALERCPTCGQPLQGHKPHKK